jgi:ribonuclease P protein subunit RPR2
MKPAKQEMYKEWLEEAREVHPINRDCARKMVAEMLEFKRKTRLSLPSYVKRFICKKCNSPLTPGRNLRIRTKNRHLVYLCKDCRHISRIPYTKQKKTGK